MILRRTSHALYDRKYHLVWFPKYRKWILSGDIRESVKAIFEEIALNHEIEIDT
jgi:putative transposase